VHTDGSDIVHCSGAMPSQVGGVTHSHCGGDDISQRFDVPAGQGGQPQLGHAPGGKVAFLGHESGVAHLRSGQRGWQAQVGQPFWSNTFPYSQ